MYGFFYFGNTVVILMVFRFVFCQTAINNNEINAEKYLEKYGYLNANENSLTSKYEALINFQEFYKLPVDGLENAETLKLMRRPRCGVSDNIHTFRLHINKWEKTHLKWYFSLARHEEKEVAKQAFSIWQNVTNLKFEYSATNPDIIISFAVGSRAHPQNSRCMKGSCNGVFFEFDGNGGILAHAYSPFNDSCREIHLDSSEKWYLGYDDIPKVPTGEISLLYVLTHEIGHVLGLRHSDVQDSMMYPLYGTSRLTQDDILGVQSLYGDKTTTTTTATTTTTSSMSSSSKSSKEISLCNLEMKNLTFLILHQNLYIFHKDRFWIMSLKTKKITSSNLSLRKVFPFLPHFDQITGVYQTPEGYVVLVIKDDFFYISFPQLKFKKHYKISQLNIPFNETLIGAVNTYSGKTLLFFSKNYYVKINDCSFEIESYGYIADDFTGIPSDMDGVFRYINGMLYFFQKGRYFEYNEFTDSLQTTDVANFEQFGIPCPDQSLYEKLSLLLSKILSSREIFSKTNNNNL